MTPENIARVDTWLSTRGIAPGTASRLQRLARAWVTLRDLWIMDDAAESAMLGVLLGLVREAWDDPTIVSKLADDGLWRVKTCMHPRILAGGDSEVDALITTLGFAP